MQIENLVLIGVNGERIPEGISQEERRRLFPPLGIVKVSKIEWKTSDNAIHFLDLTAGDATISWELLPDRSGFCLVRNSPEESQACILNADSSVRFLLVNPLLSSPYYESGDECRFTFPTVESGQPGYHAYIWSSKDGGKTGVSSEYLCMVDPSTGVFTELRRSK
jgi:hypothetical protein